MKTPKELAQAQLEAYNRRDIDAFCACFADDVKVDQLGVPGYMLEGIAAFRACYAEVFRKCPNLRADIIHRAVIGDRVVDHERVWGRTGALDGEDLYAIYECAGGKIRKVTFVRSKAFVVENKIGLNLAAGERD